MALFMDGLTCQICGAQMHNEDRLVFFPAFVGYQNEPLCFFNDSCFHEDCFLSHPLATQVEMRRALLDEYHRQYDRICSYCHNEIMNPDDFFLLPLFSENPEDRLYQYNYLRFHIQCLNEYPDISIVYEAMRGMLESGTLCSLGFQHDIDLLARLLGCK